MSRFLSTLSLRRATRLFVWIAKRALISIHALLAESDTKKKNQPGKLNISIHALLAESDHGLYSLVAITPSFLSTLSLRRATTILARLCNVKQNFYPRSPCGERRVEEVSGDTWARDFYPRSPCGERQCSFGNPYKKPYFYPRSPCGERHTGKTHYQG